MIGKLPKGSHELARDITLVKARAGQLGLFKTMHALEPATQAIGWEMAEILEGKRPDMLMPHPQQNEYDTLLTDTQE